MRKTLPTLAAICAAAGLALSVTPATALKIQLNNLNNVTPGSQAHFGFTQAARFWELAITSKVTVSLDVGFSKLNPGVLGSTGSTTNVAFVSDVLPQLRSTGNSALDAIAMANLPTLRPSIITDKPNLEAIDALISAAKSNGAGVALPLTRALDQDGSGNNSAFSANTSLLKALGFTPTYSAANTRRADGTIQFSSEFAFDFDPTNGIDSNKIDFIGVAIHEIGHALGFRSGVDTYDSNAGTSSNLNNFAIMSIWDLFRYSEQSAAMGVNDWAIGGNGASAPYFSIDGGDSQFKGSALLATGRTNGDRQQASHWKDNAAGQSQLGLMDPTVAFGQQDVVEMLDLAAMDAMGWNIAIDALQYNYSWSTRDIPNLGALPEPGSLALVGLAVACVGVGRRRKRA